MKDFEREKREGREEQNEQYPNQNDQADKKREEEKKYGQGDERNKPDFEENRATPSGVGR